MISEQPFNTTLMDVDNFIEKNYCGEVRSQQIYEPSSTKFHSEGLFSEEIFGEIGSDLRYIKFGYINLHAKVFHPLLFINLIRIRSVYKDIMSSKTYAYFDKDKKDFIICPKSDPKANTGFSFFLEHFNEIEFSKTSSRVRDIKLRIFEKYRNLSLISKCIVMPAGIRDATVDDTGRTVSEEINDIYSSIISLSQAIPQGMEDHPIFNSVRFNLQLKVVEVYNYISNILKGKRGYGSGKYMARRLAHGTRNVFSSVILEGETPEDPRYLKHDETLVPLFQTMKMFQPLIQFYLNEYFFKFFISDSNTASLINTKTLKLEYTEISDKEKNKYTTNDGLEIIINKFINVEDREKPVYIKNINNELYYTVLVYDEGDKITFVRSVTDFKQNFLNMSSIKFNEKNINYLDKLDDLNLNNDEYIIIASGAMALYGYNHSNNDLDIIVRKDVQNKLIQNKKITTKIENNREKYTDLSKTLDIGFSNDSLFDFDILYEKSIIIGNHRYLTIDGLKYIYSLLVNLTNKDKYKDRLNWLNETFPKKIFNQKLLRPLTWIELMYIITYKAANNKYMLNTRYPVIHVESIYPSKVHVATTKPSRIVSHVNEDEVINILPEYPIFKAQQIDSMAVHHSQLANLVADFDGDMGNGTGLMSDEANKEIANYFNSISSMVDSRGGLVTGVHGDTLVPWVLANMSRTRIKPTIDLSQFRPSLSRIKYIDLFKELMPLGESILIGDALLAALGLVKNTKLFSIVSEHTFNAVSLSKKFYYDVKQDEYHTENNEISIFLNHYDLNFDDLIYDCIRINSVLFAHPKYMYKIYKKQNTQRSKELCTIYEQNLKNYIK